MKRLVFAIFAAIALVMGMTGCNTVRGAGQDIENAGHAVTDNT